MRKHWGELYKKLRNLAAPAAACLLLSPIALAQNPYYAASESVGSGSVGTVQLQEHVTPPPAPTPVNPNSPSEIFSPGFKQVRVHTPFSTSNKPQSLDTPNMIGDFFGRTGTVAFSTTTAGSLETIDGIFDLPGSGRIPKVAENNSAIPRDRFYFAYNHFHSAYGSNITVDANDVMPDPMDPMMMIPIDPVTSKRQFDVNRFTLGVEKSFFYGDMSVEVRVPLVLQTDYAVASVTDPTMQATFFGNDDPMGSVSAIFKKVLLDWYGPGTSGVVTGGVGFTFPTTEGATVELGDASFHVDDAGFHVAPYMAVVITGEPGWFIQGFAETDFSADKIGVSDRNAGGVGRVDIPDVVNLDVGFGWWLYKFPQRRWWKGLAPMIEYHYSRQKEDFKSISFTSSGAQSSSNVIISGFDSRRDISNLTTGLHVIINDHINARVAGVVPLNNGLDREFDAEVAVQIDIVR